MSRNSPSCPMLQLWEHLARYYHSFRSKSYLFLLCCSGFDFVLSPGLCSFDLALDLSLLHIVWPFVCPWLCLWFTFRICLPGLLIKTPAFASVSKLFPHRSLGLAHGCSSRPGTKQVWSNKLIWLKGHAYVHSSLLWGFCFPSRFLPQVWLYYRSLEEPKPKRSE